MSLRTTGIGAAIVGFILFLAHLFPGYSSRKLLAREWSFDPLLRPTGETLVLISYVSRGVAFVLAVGVVFALGYRAGSRLDLRADYKQFVKAIGGGGMIGYTSALILVALLTTDASDLADNGGLLVVVLLAKMIAVALEFAVVGFAGASFSAFITETGQDGKPTAARENRDVHADSHD